MMVRGTLGKPEKNFIDVGRAKLVAKTRRISFRSVAYESFWVDEAHPSFSGQGTGETPKTSVTAILDPKTISMRRCGVDTVARRLQTSLRRRCCSSVCVWPLRS